MMPPRAPHALLCALILSATGCGGSDEPSPSPSSPTPTAPAPTKPPTPTRAPTPTPAPTPPYAWTPSPTPADTPSEAPTETLPPGTPSPATPTAPPGETPTPEPTPATPTPSPTPTPEEDAAFSVEIRWSGAAPDAQVDVLISDPQGRQGWYFGMAETGAGGAGWYGEDCYLGTGSYHFCHPISGDRLQLEQALSIGAVEEGETTLFWEGAPLTYFLESSDGECWVWGHDRRYFSAEGCNRLSPDGSPFRSRGGCSGMDPADPAPLGGWVALTFDDGPHPTHTAEIVEILQRLDVPATFFVLGERVSDDRTWSILEEIIADPRFEVANHSWDHADLATLPVVDVRGEIVDTTALIETFDTSPAAFRFPYGSSTCETADLARDLGYLIAGWHIDTADWCYAAVGREGECKTSSYWRVPAAYEDDMEGFILDQVDRFDGGIFLFHDIHAYTAAQLESVILALRLRGYQFVALDDLTAFPRLNANNPYPFPWVGEACDTAQDTCWQVEYQSWCQATGDPDLPDTAGVCVLPCEEGFECIDRDGAAPLFCAATSQGGRCLPLADPLNDDCGDLPGTARRDAIDHPGEDYAEAVCVPLSLEDSLR